jgi:hypothetical protein
MTTQNEIYDPNTEDSLLSDTEFLSEEERRKAILVGELIEIYIKTHNLKESDDIYGKLFDQFYDKSITELIILRGIYN